MSLYTITGGAGFIGSHLPEALLAKGHQVRVLDDLSTGSRGNLPSGCEMIKGCITDRASVMLAMQGADGCFHLAAIASVARANEEWIATHRINQTGAVTIFDVARELGGIPVVYASSAAVYGDVGARPAQESFPPVPNTAYGADKLGCELHGRVAHLVHGVPNLGLRFFNVYGPRQDPLSPYSGVISIFARMVADGGPLSIHGDGGQTRDFIYVGDVVSHLVQGMSHISRVRDCQVLNVCTGTAISVLDLARVMMEAGHLSASLIRHTPGRPGDIRNSVGNPARAQAMLGLRAEISLQDGLRQTTRAMQTTLQNPASRTVLV